MIQPPALNLSPAESSRVAIQTLRWALLNQDYGDDPAGEANIRGAIDGFLGPERAALIPRVDFSNNIIETTARQLTTPGLYQRAPQVRGPAGGEAVMQALTDAGYWLWMQRTMYLAAGMGDALLHFGMSGGKLHIREVRPSSCLVDCSPEDPAVVLRFREVRLRDLSALGLGLKWCFDVYDLREPCFYVETIDNKPIRVTNIIEGAPAEGYEGAAYPWRVDGRPVLPYVHYAVSVSGSYWHHNERRGLTRATLRAMAFDTMAHQSAMDSSHSTAIAINVDLPAAPTSGNDGSGGGQSVPGTRMAILPGSLLALDGRDNGAQPQIVQLRPAADLAQLRLWAQAQEAQLLTRLGLSADDVRSAGDNPMSADALMIKQAAKQAVADRLEPLFRAADLEALALAGAMLGGPTSGYTIAYYRPPQAAEERKADAEADAAELQLGMVSRVQLYQRRHPGASRADAITALKEIDADNAALSDDNEGPEDKPEDTPSGDAADMEDDYSDMLEELDGAIEAADAEEVDLPAIRAALEDLRARMGPVNGR